MARCPDCNKFVSLDSENDPEVSLDVDDSGEVTGTVEIENTCAECGTTMFTSSFDVAVSADEIKDAAGKTLADFLDGLLPEARETLEIEVEEASTGRTSRTEGKGRGTRTFYGGEVAFDVTVKWTVGNENAQEEKSAVFSGNWSDDVQASSMDQAY